MNRQKNSFVRLRIKLKGRNMAAEKKRKVHIPLPKKTYWHLYSLQNLESEKLAKIVNKVLKKECVLVK